VRKLLCLVALCAMVFMAGSAFAQSLHLRASGTPGHHNPGVDSKPSYCKPCLFYGGDWNSESTDWVLFANADEAGFGGLVQVYNSFKVPAGQNWAVTGLFANVGFINIDKMAPSKPEYAIHKGMSAGNGGTTVASGKKKGTAVATGRTADSGAGPVVEYTVLVKGLTGINLPAGTYQEDVTPQCHATNNAACSSALYYESDTFDDTETKQGANHFGPKEPAGKNFQNSDVFGLNYVQINSSYCTSNGFPAPACNWMSAGVIGTSN
jgi:hypothetical protein